MSTDQLSAHTADVLTHQRSLDFVRFLSCLYDQGGGVPTAAKLFAIRYPRAIHGDVIQKAAVAPGTATDAIWGAPLAPIAPLAEAFLAYVRPLTVLGRLNLRHVPFNISIPAMTAPTVAGWAGEGASKFISQGAFATVTLGIAKVIDIVILTDELLRLIVPASEVALRQELAAAVAAFLDLAFLDPSKAAVPGVSPGSITNAITPITPSGTTSAALVADMSKLTGQFAGANKNATNAVIVMRSDIAGMLVAATKTEALNANTGGMYAGYPVIVGDPGTAIVMLDTQAILYADGGIEFDTSRQATIQMSDSPDSPAVATTTVTSLWAMNLAALRAERMVNWKRARTSAVSLISPTAYVSGT